MAHPCRRRRKRCAAAVLAGIAVRSVAEQQAGRDRLEDSIITIVVLLLNPWEPNRVESPYPNKRRSPFLAY